MSTATIIRITGLVTSLSYNRFPTVHFTSTANAKHLFQHTGFGISFFHELNYKIFLKNQ